MAVARVLAPFGDRAQLLCVLVAMVFVVVVVVVVVTIFGSVDIASVHCTGSSYLLIIAKLSLT